MSLAGWGGSQPAAEKSVSNWKHSWHWWSVSESAFIINLFWRDWTVDEGWGGDFCVCVSVWSWIYQRQICFGRRRPGSGASHMLSGFVGVFEKRGQKKASYTRVLTGNSAILDMSNGWEAELFHSVQISLIAAKAFFLPFSVIHITPTITARRGCIFCLCKPRRQCVHWVSGCFWNVSSKLFSAKYPSFFSVVKAEVAESVFFLSPLLPSPISFSKLVTENSALVWLCSDLNCHGRGSSKLTNILAAGLMVLQILGCPSLLGALFLMRSAVAYVTFWFYCCHTSSQKNCLNKNRLWRGGCLYMHCTCLSGD